VGVDNIPYRGIGYIWICVYINVRERAMPADNNYELFRLKAELCKTFADPRRLMIITQLREGECSVSDLVAKLASPQAVVSRHLAVLRSRGIVVTRREGSSVYYRLANRRIIEACDIVHSILMDNLARDRDLAERLL
jgi:DNA-binding transcriptional ArsR family regulator